MDKLAQYRALSVRLLQGYADLINRTVQNELETYTIFDETRDHYMLYRSGWQGKKRIHTPILYVRLHNGKFWIEEDYTEDGIATNLLEEGIPNEDIVLAFRHPEMRPLTEFAVA